jgi:hypothetical protein
VCTVSLVPTESGVRLVANRDEQRTRPAALPPSVVATPSGVRAIMPIDPASRGTWIAVNELGLAVALLNVNPPAPSEVVPPRSRGEIVPALAALDSLEAVTAAVAALDFRQYAPFRLVCAEGGNMIEIAPRAARVRRAAVDAPVMFTSSGLGDDRVEAPRQTLFASMLLEGNAGGRLRERQDAFHAHRWSEAPHLSVLMERADARTVSRTIVEIGEERVELTYSAPPRWVAQSASLRRQRADSSR